MNPRCGFSGDGVELYAGAKKLDVSAAAYDLLSAGVLSQQPDIHVHIEAYLDDLRQELQGAMGWWKDKNQRFLKGSTAAAAILQARGCWGSTTTTAGPEGLGPLLGVATGKEIQDLTEERQFLVQGWRNYLIIPFWADARTITGFSCLSEEGDAVYIHLDRRTHSFGFGFFHTLSLSSPKVLIVNHPLTGLETIANSLATGLPVAVLYAHDRSNTWPSVFVTRRIFLNTSGSLDTYRQALKDPSAMVVSPVDLSRPQPQQLMTPQARMAHLDACGSLVHASLGNFLSSLEHQAAKASALRLELTPQDIARVLSGVSDTARAKLQDIFQELMDNQVVRYNGDSIVMRNGAWFSQKKGDEISNTIFMIDLMTCDSVNNEQAATGLIIQGNRQFRFDLVPVHRLQKKPEVWLQEVMNANQGEFVRVAHGWSAKLYDISLQFKKPATDHSVVSTGWANENKRLVLPQIYIESGEVTKSSALLKGAGAGLTGMGEPWTWELDEVVQDTPEAAMFWALFAVVTTNVFAPHHPHGTSGIGLVEAKGTALETIASDAVDAIGIERVVFASTSPAAMKEIKAKETRGVLPIYVDEVWSKSRGFAQWQKLDTQRNALVSMSKPVAIASSLCGEWIYISHKGAQPSGTARALARYWNMLPEFWAYLQKHGTWETTRSSVIRGLLRGPVSHWLRTFGYENPAVLKTAAELVTVDIVASQAPWGYRFMGLLIESVRAGALRSFKAIETDEASVGVIVDDAADSVFISKSAVNELLMGLGVEPPLPKEIADRLLDASCLIGQRYKGSQGYVMPLDRWNLCWSLKI